MYLPKRIIPLLMLIICAPIGSLKAQGTNNSESNQSPNIIFILTDDQRFDALGYAGNSLIHTPEMDKLAAAGTYFKNATVSTPICAASRASILSGLYERTHRFNFQTGNVRQAYMDNAYPKLLRDAGYHTGFFGKYGIRYNGEDQLFDDYETYDRNNAYKDQRGYYYKTLNEDTVHLTRYTGQKAIDFIEAADPNKPFCLSLSFSAPHAHDPAEDQYFWQSETDVLLQDITMPGPELGEDKYFNEQPEFVRAGFNRLRWTWRYDTEEKYQHSVKGYYRMISGVDLEIEKIRAKLAEKGLDKNTVIIVMGDNGYFLGERQLAGKWLLYDNSIRVPLIVFDPRAEVHQDSEELAQNVDVPATILDLAGVEQPSQWQGKSLMPIVHQEKSRLERDTVLIEHIWEFENIPPSEGVRTKGWKYFRYVNDKSYEELYDLRHDPQEVNNLAESEEHQQTLLQFRQKCDELIKKNSDDYSNPPTHLSVEFIRKPEAVLLKDSRPEFNWIVPGGSVFQSAYQLLVASSKENIERNIGDIWDSGQIRESRSSGVEYAGAPLTQGVKYHWKIRIWDEINRLSHYSESQVFQIGESGASQTTSNVFQIDHITPVSFQQTDKRSYFVDFGKDAFGTLAFVYEAKKAHTLTIRIGEKLDNGQIDRNPGGNIRYQEIQVPVTRGSKRYELAIQPNERNTNAMAVVLPDSFPVLMPFRYAEIENVRGNLTQENMTQLAYHGYWEEDQSSFTSSDDILNQVWELCKYSIKATTFTSYYVDGDRERIPYEADAYLNQLSHYCVDQEYAIGRKTIEYFFDSKPTWPTEWQLHVAMMMYQDYMYTGNTEIISAYYERLKAKTLMALEVEDGFISTQSQHHNGEFLLSLGFPDSTKKLRDIVDWPPESNNFGGINKYQKGERDGYVFKRINTVVNGFYYHNMKIMAQFATVLNKPDEALEFEFRAAQVKRSINEQLFDEEKGYYVDGVGTDHGSLHANMILLAFDLVPDTRKAQVIEHIKSRGMACSVYGAQYLLEALYKEGEADYALELMSATDDRSWYNMIRSGSTITLEAWDMEYKVNADWNHAWGAVPANIIPRYLWGIQPQTPGYDIASINPQMGTLKNSSIEVPTIKGIIRGEYKFVTRRLQTYTIEIPSNMVAEFEIDVSADKSIRLNGEKVSMAFGSIRLMPGIHQIDIVVNSF